MPATPSQYWFTGILTSLSFASVLYTFRDGDITNTYVQERDVESQKAIDSLSDDMSRLLRSIGNWQTFCEDPYRYIESASVHGSFNIKIKDGLNREELMTLSQAERDAMARCGYTRGHPHHAQFRLCLSILEASNGANKTAWFDHKHLFELNVQFRQAGLRLLSNCKDLGGKGVEMQSYFSAYKTNGEAQDIKRISGGVRIPLENGGQSSY